MPFSYEVAKDPAQGSPPRVNFDNFYNSFTTLLMILLNEEWHIVMYDYMRYLFFFELYLLLVSVGATKFLFLVVFLKSTFISSIEISNNNF